MVEERETWLVTGGAGYIGSHVVNEFLRNGKNVVVYDSLLSGLDSRINFLSKKYGREVKLIEGDIRDSQKLEKCMQEHQPLGIVHSAALKSVEESFKVPDEYMEVNFFATKDILQIATRMDIRNFVFSSTAAVYGSPNHSRLIKENDEKAPLSPYGNSKLLAEQEVERFSSLPDNNGVSLRFFNVVGSAAYALRDNSTDNLVPKVLNRLLNGLSPIVFGNDYPTPDGTCIRDYIDVRDIATAHLSAANINSKLPFALNIGTNKGASVLEVISLLKTITEASHIPVVIAERRLGDPMALVADTNLARAKLNFKARFQLSESINTLI